jgi:hypothetical protein
MFGNPLGLLSGDAEDRHADVMLPDTPAHRLHPLDFDATPLCFFRVLVEGRDDLEPLLGKSPVAQERLSEVSDTDQNDRLEARAPKNFLKAVTEQDDFVAGAAFPKRAAAGEILAKLGRLHSGHSGKSRRGDDACAVGHHEAQASQIEGEPVDGFLGNLPGGMGLSLMMPDPLYIFLTGGFPGHLE